MSLQQCHVHSAGSLGTTLLLIWRVVSVWSSWQESKLLTASAATIVESGTHNKAEWSQWRHSRQTLIDDQRWLSLFTQTGIMARLSDMLWINKWAADATGLQPVYCLSCFWKAFKGRAWRWKWKLQANVAVAHLLQYMSAVRYGDPHQSTGTTGSGRTSLLVRPALIEIQTGANEACNQIRAKTLGRLQGRLGIRATRPTGSTGKISGVHISSSQSSLVCVQLTSNTRNGWKNMHVLEIHT